MENEFDEKFEEIAWQFTDEIRDIKISNNVLEEIKITKIQAKEGLNKKIKISTADICPKCKGEKQISNCDRCYDLKYIFTEKEIKITVPAKVKENDVIILKEKGNQLKSNEKRGDLYIKIHIFGNKRRN